MAAVARIAGRLDALEGAEAEAGRRLLEALADVLDPGRDCSRRGDLRAQAGAVPPLDAVQSSVPK